MMRSIIWEFHVISILPRRSAWADLQLWSGLEINRVSLLDVTDRKVPKCTTIIKLYFNCSEIIWRDAAPNSLLDPK